MIEINDLIQTILTYYKSILAIAASVLICLTTTSCACAGLSCSVGTESTHQALNQRLQIMQQQAPQKWEAGS